MRENALHVSSRRYFVDLRKFQDFNVYVNDQPANRYVTFDKQSFKKGFVTLQSFFNIQI